VVATCYDSPMDLQPEALLDVLALEPDERGLFHARPASAWMPRLFGGHVMAQALWAASRVQGVGVCHSLHAYFTHATKPGEPLAYEPLELRRGKSFSTYDVSARQGDQTTLTLLASFEGGASDGAEHQLAMPDTPDPESFGDEPTRVARMLEWAPVELHQSVRRRWPFEFITVDEHDPRSAASAPIRIRSWMRAREPLSDDPNLHRCALLYASDMIAFDPGMSAVGLDFLSPDVQLASLDHAMWFHRPFRADHWQLFVCESPSVGGGRGFNRGMVYDRKGQLVASLAQEALMRRTDRRG
jgi:acyl-CoA thioesterase II